MKSLKVLIIMLTRVEKFFNWTFTKSFIWCHIHIWSVFFMNTRFIEFSLDANWTRMKLVFMKINMTTILSWERCFFVTNKKFIIYKSGFHDLKQFDNCTIFYVLKNFLFFNIACVNCYWNNDESHCFRCKYSTLSILIVIFISWLCFNKTVFLLRVFYHHSFGFYQSFNSFNVVALFCSHYFIFGDHDDSSLINII